MIAWGYWLAAQNESRFDTLDFLRKDLARPLFEPYGFCDAWTTYSSVQSAVLGLDLPAYAVGSILHSAMTRGTSCVDALTTPRGHIISAAFVFPLWFFVGLVIRRLSQRRWRRKVEGKTRGALIAVGLFLLLIGISFLVLSGASLFVSGIGLSTRAAGLALWFLLASSLAAERLRVWPFDRLAVNDPA
jgi:hypothetical protein